MKDFLPDISLLPSLEAYVVKSYLSFNLKDERFFKMTMLKMAHFISTRNNRIDDLMSPEILEALEIKKRFFPYETPYLVLCVDGRLMQKVFACLHGKAFSVPAGDVKSDFLPLRGRDKLFLKNGKFSEMLVEAQKKQNGIFHIVFDSHLHCAAGKIAAEDCHCGPVSDEGLYDDIVKKMMKKKAVLEFCQKEFPTAEVFVSQTSFNPSDGFMFIGLEKPECLEFAKGAYTNEIISELVKDGKIISTAQDAEHFKELFQKHFFECDYRDDYRKSTIDFWKNFEAMSGELLPYFEEKIRSVLEFSNKKRVKQLASLLAANTFNGYLHNHNADGSTKPYPYKDHKESVVSVTLSEKGPFSGAESFFVYPENNMVPIGIKLGRNLVIKNRSNGNMAPLEIEAVNHIFGEKAADYAKAPVPAIFFQRTKKEISAEEKKKLQSIDWSGLVDNQWFDWNDQEFSSYLEEKFPDVSMNIFNAMNDLRKTAIKLYEPGQPATDDLLTGRIIPFWFLSGPDREILAPIPFLMNGYQNT
ncbi:MAG: hypothetical protein ACOYMB_01195 [Patescibacteria group bacterium]